MLSLDKLERGGWDFVKHKKQKCAWLHKANVWLKLMKINGRYRLPSKVITVCEVKALVQGSSNEEHAFEQWHARLRHLNFGAMKHMIEDGTVSGFTFTGTV